MLNIQSGLSKVLESKKTNFPLHVNRISALDDNCLRRLYYMRHDWDKATLPDDNFAGILESGKKLEPIIEQLAIEVGLACTPQWRIVGKQMATNDALLKEHQISGTIDGLLQVNLNGDWKTFGAIDIKTSDPNIYRSLSDYASLCRYTWTRKYRGQLMLYALAHNLPKCFILFVNKSNLYDMKFIEFDVDMAYCDELLKKAKAVNSALQKEIPPAKLNDAGNAPNAAGLVFAPDYTTGRELATIDNAELESILNQLEQLEGYADEYSELKKWRDSLLAKGKNIICGKWLVQWKEITKKTKDGIKKEWRKAITKV